MSRSKISMPHVNTFITYSEDLPLLVPDSMV